VETRIRYGSTDATGRIFFPKYFEFFDDAILEFFRNKGICFDYLGHVHINDGAATEALVVGECYCRFTNEVFFDDVLEVRPEIEQVGEKKITFRVTCYNKTQGKTCAEGGLTFVCVNTEEKKATKIPKRMLTNLIS
jgi:acyl-CoA thioester hydrolase